MQSPRMEFGFGGMSLSALRVAAQDIFKNGFSYLTLPLIRCFPSLGFGDILNPCWSGYISESMYSQVDAHYTSQCVTAGEPTSR